MKVILNKCFGGFGVSEDAVRYCRKNDATWAQWPNTYLPGEKWVTHDGLGGANTVHDEVADCVYIDDRGAIGCRTCPHLAQLVEMYEMISDGPINPNGPYSQLCVTEIPDGAEFEIVSNDGVEQVFPPRKSW